MISRAAYRGRRRRRYRLRFVAEVGQTGVSYGGSEQPHQQQTVPCSRSRERQL